MIVNQDNYKWFISPDGNKIMVFDDNGTLSNTGDDRIKNNSNFPGTSILSIVEDLDGEIWVGTDEGIAVFYNPSDVFDKNIEAEQILIQQDGITQILLETEIITSIAVDGANRKWIGTQSSGIYLMSEDGTEQVEHFTTENSPLFSDNIFDIVINPKTGEVYIGTEKGLISYKGTATDADDDFNNIFVYPNPVKPNYNGVIAIRGLVQDTDVRITDISGNIVYETTSLGGQAIWDGKDFNGNRVQSGVYMVFNGSQDGAKKAAAKILFIN
jgi:ligand-binding sensor domain-containing protein